MCAIGVYVWPCITVSECFLFRNHFYQFGEIRTITVVQRQQCAFIQFATRQAAEVAAEKSFNKLIVNGRRLNVKWGRWVSGQEKRVKAIHIFLPLFHPVQLLTLKLIICNLPVDHNYGIFSWISDLKLPGGKKRNEKGLQNLV